jgi:hypothetical protein
MVYPSFENNSMALLLRRRVVREESMRTQEGKLVNLLRERDRVVRFVSWHISSGRASMLFPTKDSDVSVVIEQIWAGKEERLLESKLRSARECEENSALGSLKRS